MHLSQADQDLAAQFAGPPVPTLFDQALRAAVPNTLRPAANHRKVLFSISTRSDKDAYLTPEQALEKFASDGDVRAWIARAQPDTHCRLDALRDLHCHDAEEVEARLKEKADYERRMAEHRAKYGHLMRDDRSPPASAEAAEWDGACGVRR